MSAKDGVEGELPELEMDGAAGGATLAGLLGERYEVRTRLGAGAFGEVFRAHDRLLGRDVAIKRIRLDAFADAGQLEEVKARFLREAQVAARLRHPNIVTTHDIVSSPSSSFIVMELVEGVTLQGLLAARGRLDLPETVALLGQVGAALDHAHARGVVHRDVKPANVMVEPSGVAKVMDFGIAKADVGGHLTATGLVMGTPHYMSPEQAHGERADARSDLFSLGCVLYECLAGRRPFAGDSVPAILLRVVSEEPPEIDAAALGLPDGVKDVLRRATAKAPAARYSTAAEMIGALSALGGSATDARSVAAVPSPTVAVPSRVEPGPRRLTGRTRLAAASAAVLVLAGLGGLAVSRASRPKPVAHVLPAGTMLRLALESPVSSATTVEGETVVARLQTPVMAGRIEVLPTGSRVTGRVSHAASAEQAAGRGELTVVFERLEPPDGDSASIATRPLGMRAPAPRRKDNAFVAGLKELGSAVGGLIGGRDGAAAGSVVGGTAATVIVAGQKGRDVTLPEGAPLTVELAADATVLRPPPR